MADKTPLAEEQLSQANKQQSLSKPLRWAIAIHVVVLVVSFIGLPHYKRPLDISKAVVVDLVAPTGDVSAAPNRTKNKNPFKPNAKPLEQKKPAKTEPKPEPPKPKPAAKSDDAKKVDVPKPEEKKLEPPKEQPKKEAPKKVDKKVKLEKPKEKKKVEPKKEEAEPEEFNSVLKNLLGEPDPQQTEPEGNPIDEILDETAKTEGSAPVTSETLSLSDMDALKYQLQRCWNVPVGAMDAEKLIIDIRIEVNPDRTVRSADIIDKARYNSDDFFRAAADSAKRALFNPLCTPLALPPEKYDVWKTILFQFNPRDMFGG